MRPGDRVTTPDGPGKIVEHANVGGGWLVLLDTPKTVAGKTGAFPVWGYPDSKLVAIVASAGER